MTQRYELYLVFGKHAILEKRSLTEGPGRIFSQSLAAMVKTMKVSKHNETVKKDARLLSKGAIGTRAAGGRNEIIFIQEPGTNSNLLTNRLGRFYLQNVLSAKFVKSSGLGQRLRRRAIFYFSFVAAVAIWRKIDRWVDAHGGQIASIERRRNLDDH